MKEKRWEERQKRRDKVEDLKSSVFASVSQGKNVTLASLVIGKDKSPPKAFKDSRLHLIINDDIVKSMSPSAQKHRPNALVPEEQKFSTKLNEATQQKLDEMAKQEAEA